MRFTIPHDHPALAGHFPHRPIVPGVMILDEVLAGLARYAPDLNVTGIAHAKFTAPLLPEQVCELSFQPGTKGMRYTCTVAGQIIATGLLELAP